MNARIRPVLDASGLSRRQAGHDSPLWWAILGLIAIELTVVAIFISSYFYLRMGQPAWPPAGIEPPPLLWPTVNLVLMLGSIVAMAWSGRAIKRGDRRRFQIGIWLAVSGACLVLVFRSLQLDALEFRWDEHAYGSLVWTLTGFHFVHVTATVLGTAAIAIAGSLGYFNEDRYLGVDVDAMYWYFVALAWIPLYLVLYWGPRLFPGTPL